MATVESRERAKLHGDRERRCPTFYHPGGLGLPAGFPAEEFEDAITHAVRHGNPATMREFALRRREWIPGDLWQAIVDDETTAMWYAHTCCTHLYNLRHLGETARQWLWTRGYEWDGAHDK